MNVVDGILHVRANWFIVRSLTFPTLYRFPTFVIFNIVTVLICKFFISYDSRVLLWVPFEIISLKIFVRKIVSVIISKILIRCEIFLSWFKIIRPFCFPVWQVLPFLVLVIARIFFLHGLLKGLGIIIFNYVLNMKS